MPTRRLKQRLWRWLAEHVTDGRASVACAAIFAGALLLTHQNILVACVLPGALMLFGTFATRWWDIQRGSHGAPDRPVAESEVKVAGLAGARPETLWLAGTAALLALIGAAMVYSSSSTQLGAFAADPSALHYERSYLYATGLGLVIVLIVQRVSLPRLLKIAPAALAVALGLTLLTLVPHIGVFVGGARRWLRIDGIVLQPAQLLKLSLILVSVRLYGSARRRRNDYHAWLGPMFTIAFPAGVLILAEPDVGTALVIAYALAALLLTAGVPPRHLVIAGILVLGTFVLILDQSSSFPSNVLPFLPSLHRPETTAAQLTHSTLAFGSGGVTGRGFGQSIQKAFYLRQANSTFILAVVAEEFGLVGTSVVLGLLSILVLTATRTALRQVQVDRKLLAAGLAAMLATQSVVSALVVLGLGPPSSIGLPFISNGPTDIVVSLTAVGLLLSLGSTESDVTEAEWEQTTYGLRRRLRVMNRRIRYLRVSFVLLLLLCWFRAAYLAVWRGPELRRAAYAETVTERTLAPRRGAILDQNGLALATTRRVYVVVAIPAYVAAPLSEARSLQAFVKQPRDRLVNSLSGTGRAPVALGVLRGGSARRRLNHLSLAGISVVQSWKRVYPDRLLSGSVVGALNSQGVGMSGIEATFDKTLRGRPGYEKDVLNARGQVLATLAVRRPLQGRSVRLTLDGVVQAEVQAILATVSKQAGADRAAAVVMNPTTGAVLAMAAWSSPGASGLKSREGNLGVGLLAPVGEQIEPFLAAAKLKAGVSGLRTRSPGPRRHRGSAGLTISRLAHRLSPSATSEWLGRFGFGRESGLPLPGDRPGIVPPATVYTRNTLASVVSGDGVSATPIQLARAYSVIAANGAMHAPQLVQNALHPPPAGTRVVAATVAGAIRGLVGPTAEVDSETALLNPSGGGRDQPEVWIKDGWAPARTPRLVLTLVLEKPMQTPAASSELTAAFGEITDIALSYLGLSGQ